MKPSKFNLILSFVSLLCGLNITIHPYQSIYYSLALANLLVSWRASWIESGTSQ